MQPQERQQLILKRLDARGQVTISDLSRRLSVSEMTIRRDLDQLETEGLLRRTHGGAVRAYSSSFEPPFTMRAHLNTEAKRAIAAWGATTSIARRWPSRPIAPACRSACRLPRGIGARISRCV